LRLAHGVSKGALRGGRRRKRESAGEGEVFGGGKTDGALDDSGDLGEFVEVDWKSSILFAGGDLGVSGVELLSVVAPASTNFRVCLLCAYVPALSTNCSALCS